MNIGEFYKKEGIFVKTKYGIGKFFGIEGNNVLVEFDYTYLVSIPFYEIEYLCVKER